MRRAFVSVAWVLAIFGEANAQNVKITPLGMRTGEFCVLDRAFLLEDPTGVRILYDPGIAIAGSTDSRLGDVHVILVSHNHPDHLGAAKLNQDPDSATARCSGFPVLAATPNSNTADIAAAKKSAVLVGFNLPLFLNKRIGSILGITVPACVPLFAASNEVLVPRTSPCTAGMGISGKVTVTLASGKPGVKIALVPAVHDNSLPNDFLTEAEKTGVGLANYVDPAIGYVLTFSNGLVVYLSGDTGIFSDMKTVVNEFYGAKLAIISMGDFFTMGPEEAADAVNRLIKPKAVIPSKAQEVATTNGEVNAKTRTARFIELVKDTLVHVPKSGRVMEFDDLGNCVKGCLESKVTGLTFVPSTVLIGRSFTATFSGTGLTSKTYFDIRFRAPGATSDQVAFNWQQGISADHTVAGGSLTGTWTVSGVRAHSGADDYSGDFTAVSVTLTVPF